MPGLYNQKRKKQFLEDYTQSSKTITFGMTVFHRTAEFEERFKKDVCRMNENELEKTLASFGGVRSKTVIVRLNLLRKYVEWCLVNKIPNTSLAIFNLKNTYLKDIRGRLVSSPAQLQDYLNQVFRPEDDCSVDNVYRTVFWLAFAGFPLEEAVQIPVEAVDLNDMVIRFDGKKYPIYLEGLKAIRCCKEQSQFRYYHPRYETSWRDRMEGNLLLRGFKANPKVLRIREQLARSAEIAKEQGKELLDINYQRVYFSGMYYRCYNQIEHLSGDKMENVRQYFRQLVMEEMQGKEYKDTSKEATEYRIQVRTREYIDDYNAWKFVYQ